jgi:hypothetical protein
MDITYFNNFENELSFYLENYGYQQVLIHYRIFVNEEIINYYNNLKYKKYLNTCYWQAIRQLKLKEANYRCQQCNQEDILDVHHKTYKHRGLEFIFLNDLICLCEKCHNKEHKKGGNDIS